MRKVVLFFAVLIISVNGMTQDKMAFNLQQIEFKDSMLTKTLFDLSTTKPSDFNKHDYVLEFFQSSLSNKEYFISVYSYSADVEMPHSFAYYVVINDITYFIPGKVTLDLFNVPPSRKRFVFNLKEFPYCVGGGFHYLIMRSLTGHYQVYLLEIGE